VFASLKMGPRTSHKTALSCTEAALINVIDVLYGSGAFFISFASQTGAFPTRRSEIDGKHEADELARTYSPGRLWGRSETCRCLWVLDQASLLWGLNQMAVKTRRRKAEPELDESSGGTPATIFSSDLLTPEEEKRSSRIFGRIKQN
jgi:hypothetical protein